MVTRRTSGAQSLPFKNQGTAGNAAFGFGELVDIDGLHAQSVLLEAGPCFRKRRGANHDVTDDQRIGGVRFVGIDVYQPQVAECVGRYPVPVDEERRSAQPL